MYRRRVLKGWLARVILMAVTGVLIVADVVVGQRPTFRSAANVVPVDVSVLDKDRIPVRGLKVEDFTVYEDGKPRPLVAFAPVQIPAQRRDLPVWNSEAVLDVAGNSSGESGRLVTIVFDWSIRFQDQAAARRIATSIIDHLGAGDEAAVTFTSAFAGAGTPQGFTADRARLYEAIRRPIAPALLQGGVAGSLDDPGGLESGDCHCRICVLDTLRNVVDAMSTASKRAKVVFFVGTYFQGTPTAPGALGRIARLCGTTVNQVRESLVHTARRSNVVFHVLDPVGLQPFGPVAGLSESLRQALLTQLAADTGGRSVFNTNSPETHVAEILEESESYYLLGFVPATTDGRTRAREIRVRVNRPGLLVQFRASYDPPNKPAPVAGGTSQLLAELVRGAVPVADLPMTMSVVPWLDRKTAEAPNAVIVLHLRDRPALRPDVPAMLVAVLDSRGKVIATRQQVLDGRSVQTLAPGEGYDIVSPLRLEPGRYEIRVGVESAVGQRGSVYGFVEIPGFERDRLSLSGIVLEALPPASMNVESVFPTARREFGSTEGLRARLKIVRPPGQAPSPVQVDAEIRSAANVAVWNQARTIAGESFATSSIADYEVRLDKAGLISGSYLLRIRVVSGQDVSHRDLVFSIR